MKYRKSILALLLAGMMVFAGCGQAKKEEAVQNDATAQDAVTLNIAITKDENTLAPFTYVSGTGLTVNRLIYDTLMTTDANDEIIPWMIEDDYEVVDFKEYTLNLKEGLKFHNGKNELFKYINEGDCVYFVHSFFGVGCDSSLIASAEYGADVTAAVAKGNVYGCQFHPEKSGDVGLNILKAFCEI